MSDATRKRPDRSDAAKRRKTLDETVVKVSLPGILVAHDGRDAFREELERLVENVSKSVNKGSLLLNRFLLKRLEANETLPDLSSLTLYVQCLNIGSGRLNKPTEGLQTAWDAHFSNFPKIEKLAGNAQALTYAARTFQTNFLNSLVCAFDTRQKYLLKAWIAAKDLPKESLQAIRFAINGWTYNSTPVPDDAKEFVAEQRALLGLTGDERRSDVWLKKHPQHVIKYYWENLKYLETIEGTRRYSLSPICSIKRHFVSIDTTVLYNLMRNCGLIDKTVKEPEFRDMAEDHFESLFKTDKLASNKHTFSKMIETDGVSACVHFTCPKKTSATDGGQPRDYTQERVIAIDPGRVNIVYAEEKLPDGSYKTYKLTRGQYYESCGMKRTNRRSKKWFEEIKNEESKFSEHSPRTTSSEQFDKFIANYVSVYDKLWDNRFKKKWAQQHFRVHRKKRKVLDGFFQSMHEKGTQKPVIAYGKGGFASGGAGEVSVPTEYVKKKCKQYFDTVEVDEYRTSCVCPCCDALLSKVWKKKTDGKVHEVRGLRRCSSTVCSQASFKNRDSVGARNILRCLLERDRPNSLTRNQRGGRVELQSFMLRTGAIEATAA